MRIRGLLIVLALLVVILSGVSGSQRANNGSKTTAPTVAPQPQAAAIEATLPANGAVRAEAGQSINLLIRSDSADVAEIEKLGLSVAVGPGISGALTVVAPSDGRYPVTLQLANRTVGVIDVGS